MNKIFYLLTAFLLLFFSSPDKAVAQANADWKLLLLDVAGHTVVKGVEVYSQTNTCKEEDVIFLKLINHNAYPVTVKWFDAVQTQERKWIKKDNTADKKTLVIDANKEIMGDCSNNNYSECIIKVKNFVNNPKMFYEYAAYHFEVSEVIK